MMAIAQNIKREADFEKPRTLQLGPEVHDGSRVQQVLGNASQACQLSGKREQR